MMLKWEKDLGKNENYGKIFLKDCDIYGLSFLNIRGRKGKRERYSILLFMSQTTTTAGLVQDQ